MREIIVSTIQIGMSLIIYLVIIVLKHCWLMHLISFLMFKMIVANPSENGQVLHVIPSTQTGMAQVIVPQGQLVDVNSPQGE